MRTLLCELNRIHSHLVWLGTAALELGAISVFWYAFRERDQILDLFELAGGTRMHTRYFQVGGLAEDIPTGFYPECRKFVEWMPKAINDYEALLSRNEIWLERTEGSGSSPRTTRSRSASPAPCCAASGVDWDLRKDEPYLAYDEVDFDVPVYAERRRLRPLPRAHGRDARSRSGSSTSASTGSRGWRASRGSWTTARSCCRRGTSSTPRWSR